MSEHAEFDGIFIEWTDPADGELTWHWNAEHFPYPMTPISMDLAQRAFRGRAKAIGLDERHAIRIQFAGGYAYVWRYAPIETDGVGPIVAERARRSMENVPRMMEIWESKYEPEIAALCRALQSTDFSSMSLQELASGMELYVADSAQTWVLTQLAAEMVIACREKINAFCNREFGDRGEFIAGILSEGFTNETKSSEIIAWELAQLADSLPEVAEAFGRLTGSELHTELHNAAGGDKFLNEFRRYLDTYGWRSEMWFEVSDPTWRDDPGQALGIVQRYLGRKDEDPQEGPERTAASRRKLTHLVRRSRPAGQAGQT